MIESSSCSARLPTEYGLFNVVAFRDKGGREHLAVIKGRVSGRKNVPVRISMNQPRNGAKPPFV